MSSSGSDSGDEDYVPSDCGSQPPSEVESDGDEEDLDAIAEDTVKSGPKGKGRRRARDDPSESPKEQEEEKEDVKQKSDSLWSDFLKDVSSDGGSSKGNCVPEKNQGKVEKKTITQVYEFAGEKVTVSKEVTAEAPSKVRKISSGSAKNCDDVIAEENTSLFEEGKVSDVNEGKIETPLSGVSKQSALGLSDKSRVIGKPITVRSGASSLGSALDKLGKKNRLSTLEKSKLDWESYKNKEGISEEISAHNKGKSGYLDKRDFLEKTDLKQYELEKQFRNSQRRKL
ncbi:craniofacial development protein 1 [Hetaerina americana]|uniref:craniofacial development protein 1 n=1 Tax=Hetaerina americana TaxID=62018 RepID=UPI003A7F4D24